MCLSTIAFREFCRIFLRAGFERPYDVLFVTLAIFALGMICYILAFAIGLWGAVGIEEGRAEASSLRWTRRALNWTRTKDIPFDDITEIRSAITPWHRFRNSVEVIAPQRRSRIGDKLLRDQAQELAHHLRRATGLAK